MKKLYCVVFYWVVLKLVRAELTETSPSDYVKTTTTMSSTSPISRAYQAENFILIKGGDTRTCGGALISVKYVLTAAHCFANRDKILQTVIVYGEESKKQYQVSKNFVIHEDFKFCAKGYIKADIAIVKLTTPLVISNQVQLIDLPRRSKIIESMAGVVFSEAGWKRIKSNPTNGTMVQGFSKVVEDDDICSSSSEIICSWSLEGHAPCIKDSGSPLVVNNTVVGIVSMGLCFVNGYYTRVSSYLNWIEKNSDVKIIEDYEAEVSENGPNKLGMYGNYVRANNSNKQTDNESKDCFDMICKLAGWLDPEDTEEEPPKEKLNNDNKEGTDEYIDEDSKSKPDKDDDEVDYSGDNNDNKEEYKDYDNTNSDKYGDKDDNNSDDLNYGTDEDKNNDKYNDDWWMMMVDDDKDDDTGDKSDQYDDNDDNTNANTNNATIDDKVNNGWWTTGDDKNDTNNDTYEDKDDDKNNDGWWTIGDDNDDGTGDHTDGNTYSGKDDNNNYYTNDDTYQDEYLYTGYDKGDNTDDSTKDDKYGDKDENVEDIADYYNDDEDDYKNGGKDDTENVDNDRKEYISDDPKHSKNDNTSNIFNHLFQTIKEQVTGLIQIPSIGYFS